MLHVKQTVGCQMSGCQTGFARASSVPVTMLVRVCQDVRCSLALHMQYALRVWVRGCKE